MWNPFSSRRKCSRKLSSYDSPLFSLEFIVSSKKQYFFPPIRKLERILEKLSCTRINFFSKRSDFSRDPTEEKKKSFPRCFLSPPSFTRGGEAKRGRCCWRKAFSLPALEKLGQFPRAEGESEGRGGLKPASRWRTTHCLLDDPFLSLHELPTAKPSVLIIDDDLQGWKKLWNPLPHHHHRCRRFRASWHVSLHPRVIQILALECSGPASKVFSIRLSTRTPFIFSRVALPLSLFLLSAGNRARFSPWSPSFSPFVSSPSPFEIYFPLEWEGSRLKKFEMIFKHRFEG